MRRSTVIRLLVGVVAVGVLGVLFVRSAKNVGAEPYTVARDRLAGWTLGLDSVPEASGVVLALWPQENLAAPLFSQIFARSGLSLRGPSMVSLPLVLKGEFDRALAAALGPDVLLRIAREAGLEAVPPAPVCMASRRVSEPGSTREVFFLRLEHPAFAEFRTRVGQALRDAGGSGEAFDPAGLSPVLILAATDEGFSSWLPLRAEAVTDCLAPILVQ